MRKSIILSNWNKISPRIGIEYLFFFFLFALFQKLLSSVLWKFKNVHWKYSKRIRYSFIGDYLSFIQIYLQKFFVYSNSSGFSSFTHHGNVDVFMSVFMLCTYSIEAGRVGLGIMYTYTNNKSKHKKKHYSAVIPLHSKLKPILQQNNLNFMFLHGWLI